MNRRTWIVALVSAVLGIAIGGLAVWLFAQKNPGAFTPPPASSAGAPAAPTKWSLPAVVFGEQLNVSELLARAKPKDAKFIAGPGGEAALTRYGYDGHKSAVWEGTTDPQAVKEIIFKDLESRFQAKKWDTYRGSASSVGNGVGGFLGSYELHYHLPDRTAAGWARLFIHQEGQRVGVVLVFNTGREWPTE